ncbi:uncharacterized protein JCM10292_007123 [Rhodotorula paludigena]|uniref:uncharacterized protein n=1 Tax=Rhodotorula paludigena TaxID=86838 RepID=UPI0031809555
MGPPPYSFQPDYAHNTYLVLSLPSSSAASSPSSSASSPPPLPPSHLPLRYQGTLGPGLLASVHVYALEGVPSGATAASTEEGAQAAAVEQAKEALRELAHGIDGARVEVMLPRQRAKR